MPRFEAVYLLSDGRCRKVRLEATTREGLAGYLEGRLRAFVVSIRVVSDWTGSGGRLRVPVSVLVAGLDSLELMLASGVRVNAALQVIAEAAPSHSRRLWTELVRGVEETGSLSEAAARFPRVFREEATGVLAAHERAGRLREGICHVRDYVVRMEEVRRGSVRALSYPAVVGLIGAVIVVVLGFFTLPRFAAMLRDIGVAHPNLAARVLFSSSAFMTGHPAGLACAGVAVPLLAWASGHRRLKGMRDRVLLRMPGFGGAVLCLSLARICLTYRALAGAGVRVVETLECCQRVAGNAALAAGVGRAVAAVRRNETVGGGFDQAGIFPPDFVMAVQCGDGNLPEVFSRLAAYYSSEATHRLDRALKLLQSALLGAVVAGVLCLSLAVVLPMVQIIDEIH